MNMLSSFPLKLSLMLLLVVDGLSSVSDAQQPEQQYDAQRRLENIPYYSTSDPNVLGAPNTSAALGNPLKGLYGGVRWATPPLPEAVPLAIEWYNIGVRKGIERTQDVSLFGWLSHHKYVCIF
jgi:hypothetical protein